jgi:hypothetical protein
VSQHLFAAKARNFVVAQAATASQRVRRLTALRRRSRRGDQIPNGLSSQRDYLLITAIDAAGPSGYGTFRWRRSNPVRSGSVRDSEIFAAGCSPLRHMDCSMKKKKNELPRPYTAPTKDTRFAGTYEVLVPAPGRARPYRVPLQFETQEKAETWIHSPDGDETIKNLLSGSGK